MDYDPQCIGLMCNPHRNHQPTAVLNTASAVCLLLINLWPFQATALAAKYHGPNREPRVLHVTKSGCLRAPVAFLQGVAVAGVPLWGSYVGL